MPTSTVNASNGSKLENDTNSQAYICIFASKTILQCDVPEFHSDGECITRQMSLEDKQEKVTEMVEHLDEKVPI
jgi:hypothetical protein